MTRSTRGRDGPDGNYSTVKQTIVETLEAPRLNGISTQDFVKLNRTGQFMNGALPRKILNMR